jgi:hypothetical protein
VVTHFGHEYVGIDKRRSDHIRLTVGKSENSVKRWFKLLQTHCGLYTEHVHLFELALNNGSKLIALTNAGIQLRLSELAGPLELDIGRIDDSSKDESWCCSIPAMIAERRTTVHWNVLDDGDIAPRFFCIRPLRSRVLTKPSNLSKRSNTPTIGRARRHAV